MDRNETRDCIEMRIYTNADLRKLLGWEPISLVNKEVIKQRG